MTEDKKRQLELAAQAQSRLVAYIEEHCPDVMFLGTCAFREAPEAALMHTNGGDTNGALGMLATMTAMVYTCARPQNEWTEAAAEIGRKLKGKGIR